LLCCGNHNGSSFFASITCCASLLAVTIPLVGICLDKLLLGNDQKVLTSHLKYFQNAAKIFEDKYFEAG